MELTESSLGEQFLRFSKYDLSWFNRIFLLFEARKSCVFQIFLLRSIKAYLCPNINFDNVDFSERRPEEVINFFWRSMQGSSHGGRRRTVPPGTANFRPALGFKLDAPPDTNRTKICWICTNSIVFQASKVVVFAQCKFCMHYFAKDTHHTAREQKYFLEKCSEPVHCDPFGLTAIRAPISELTPAQTLLGCARH